MARVQCSWPINSIYDGDWNVSNTLPLTTSNPRTGETNSWRCNATTTGVASMSLRSSNSVSSHGNINTANASYSFYFRPVTLPSANSEEICQILNDSAAIKMTVRIKSDGKLQAYASNGTTQMGSDSTYALTVGNWYRIEIQCATGSPEAWAIRIYDDNDSPTQLDSFSGTGNLNTGLHRGIVLGKVTNRNGQTVDYYYTGVAIDNTITWIGHRRYKLLLPTGAGNYSGWTGAGYTNVDDSPPHDSGTTYNVLTSAATVTMQDCATVGLTSGDVITCVNSLFYPLKSGATATNLQTRVRIAGTDYTNGLGQLPPNQYYQFSYVLGLNPNTSAAWSQAAVDGMECGCVYFNGTTPNITAIWALVEYQPDPNPVTTSEHAELMVL
jgi:hypothetical protein